MGTRFDPRSQRSVSSGALILAVAVFIAVFANVAFFKTAAGTFGFSGDKGAFVASLFVYVTAILVLVLSALCHRRTVKPVLIVFLMLAAGLAYFATKYGTIFDHHMIANALQTDSAEAGDLMSAELGLYLLLLGVVPSVLVWRAPLVHPDWKTETVQRLKLAGAAAAALAAVIFSFSAHYASMVREHREITSRVVPTYAIYSAFKLAIRSMPEGDRTHKAIAVDAIRPPADNHRELVIMVVGETARADHWGLNGYARDTTPRLRAEKVINFPDFWACDTSTARSVPCMFSNLGRAGFTPEKAALTDSALDVLSRAGVSVLWRDNNSSSKGVADRVKYEDYKSPKLNTMCEDSECRDEGMLVGLQEYIDGEKGDVMIVLHQMGNHGPAYYKRYPKEFERFKPVCATNDLGSCTSEEIDNAYDNALLYTDYFLSRVIELLKKNGDTFETAMVYVSDHGESLGEMGLYLHGTPYMLAPQAQKHVPAVVWLGDGIKSEIGLDDVEERRKRRFSHDNLFATLLGFFEIRSGAYDPKLDIFERLPEIAEER